MTANKEQQEAELLPCPFCGGEPKLITWHEHTEARHIQCTQCECMTGKPHFMREFAIKDWNNRAKLTSQVASGEAVCSICNNSGYYCTGYSGLECDGNAPMLERCDCEIGQPTPSPSNVLVEALREITYSHDGYARKKAEQALATYSASTDSVMSLYDGDVKLGDIEMTKPTANEWGKKP